MVLPGRTSDNNLYDSRIDMRSIIIQGSSRSVGNTNQIAKIFQAHLDAEIIDLSTKEIHQYSYAHDIDDDFLPLMREVVQYDTIVLITPVYWYAMSGIMKTFFDRITDCLKIDKETGRKLRTKNMIAVSCGSDHDLTEGFFVPFRNSASYLGMTYLGDIHTWIENEKPDQEVLDSIDFFMKHINEAHP
jgi:multimeric flavodoxin WrbA